MIETIYIEMNQTDVKYSPPMQPSLITINKSKKGMA